MNIKELEQNLDSELDSFSEELKGITKEGGTRNVTEDELHWVARHTFYALSGFKKNIVEYLKDK